MPFNLIFEVQYPDEKPLRRALVVYERVQDLSPAFERILPLLQDYTDRYLEAGGAFEGNLAFAPLSARYARWKARRYPNTPILTRTGRLRASLSTLTDDSIAQIAPDRLTYGTKVPYALYHQMGTRKAPKRPPLRLSKPLTGRILNALRRYLVEVGEG